MKDSRILIGTDTFHKKGSPHLMVTAIDCDDINSRENKYNDVVGFYKYSPNMDELDDSIVKDMDDWADILKKNILCLVGTDSGIKGWLFKNQDEVSYQEIQVYTLNDVNYDVWLDPDTSFWNPVDFLLEAEYYSHPMMTEDEMPNLDDKFDMIEKKIEILNSSVLQLAGAIRGLLQSK